MLQLCSLKTTSQLLSLQTLCTDNKLTLKLGTEKTSNRVKELDKFILPILSILADEPLGWLTSKSNLDTSTVYEVVTQKQSCDE